MNLSRAIYTILHSDADVEGMVGLKIYPDIVKRHSSLPAITYTLDSVTPTETKDSVATWDEVFVSITCFGNTRLQCEELSGYVRVALTRVSGQQGIDLLRTSNYLGENWGYDNDDTRAETGQKGFGVYMTFMNFRIVISDTIGLSAGTGVSPYVRKDDSTLTLTVGNNTLTHSKGVKLRTLTVSDSSDTNNYFPNWINTDENTATIEWVGATLTNAKIKYSY